MRANRNGLKYGNTFVKIFWIFWHTWSIPNLGQVLLPCLVHISSDFEFCTKGGIHVSETFPVSTADNECNTDITKILDQRFIRDINQTAWFSQLLFPVVYCVEFSNGTSLNPASWRWNLGNSINSVNLGEIFPLYIKRIHISRLRLSLYALSIFKYLPIQLMFYK